MRKLLLALIVLSSVAGCDKIAEKLGHKVAEKAIEGASGGDVKVDSSKGGVTITGKDGTVVTGGTNSKVPDGWPATVPIYPGAAVASAMTTPTAKSVTLSTKDPKTKVVDFYKKSGLGLESEMDLGPQHILNFKHGTGSVAVILGGVEGQTSITVTITG